MMSQTLDRSSLHNPYTYHSSPVPHGYRDDVSYRDDLGGGGDSDAVAAESVDLLQMVPDRSSMVPDRSSTITGTPSMVDRPVSASRDSLARTASQAKVHCASSVGGSPARRSVQRMVLLPSDTEGEDDSNPLFHTCGHGCSRHDIYYSRVPANPATGTDESVYTRRRDDGSVYFNYLQLSKQRGGGGNQQQAAAYGSHPSLYTHHKHVNCGQASKEYFKCCKKNTNLRSNSTSRLYSHFSKSFKRKSDSGGAGDNDDDNTTYGTASSKLKKRREWTRIKRLMFLVGILIGIVIALGGLVIGFLVLAPKHTELTAECPEGHIFCANTGCVIKADLCSAHHSTTCPNLDLQRLCANATSSNKEVLNLWDESKKRTVTPSVPKPVKDKSGWVWYEKGSPNGSKYVLVDMKVPFHAAQEECRRRGGHLVHIDTVREQVFIEDFLMTEMTEKAISGETSGFWIGARRKRGSHSGTCMYQQWEWLDAYGRAKSKVAGFTAFVPGKPDNHYKPEECLYLAVDQGEGQDSYLKWNDIPCDLQSIAQIKILCEVENR